MRAIKKYSLLLAFFVLLLFENVSTIHNSKDRIKPGNYQRETYISEALENQHHHHHHHHHQHDEDCTHDKSSYHQTNSQINEDASLNYQQGLSRGYQNVEDKSANYQGQYTSQTKSETNKNLAAEYYTKCPADYTGILPYAYDCYKFLNCWNGDEHLQICAPGTVFNPNTLECDSPEHVSCSGIGSDQTKYYPSENVEEPPAFTQNQRTGRLRTDPVYLNNDQQEVSCPHGINGVSPHPNDCSKFLNCANGMMFIQECGPNTMFSATMLTCDFTHNVDCGTRQIIGVDKNYFSENSNDKATALDENDQQINGQPTNVEYNYHNRDSKSFSGGSRQNQLTDQTHYHNHHHQPAEYDENTNVHGHYGFNLQHHHHHHHHQQPQPSQSQSTYKPLYSPQPPDQLPSKKNPVHQLPPKKYTPHEQPPAEHRPYQPPQPTQTQPAYIPPNSPQPPDQLPPRKYPQNPQPPKIYPPHQQPPVEHRPYELTQPTQSQPAYLPPYSPKPPDQLQPRKYPPYQPPPKKYTPHQLPPVEHRPRQPSQEEQPPIAPQEEQSLYPDRWTQMDMKRPKAPDSPNSFGNRPQYIPATHPVTETFSEKHPTSWNDNDSKTVRTWTSHDRVQPTFTQHVVEGKVDYQPNKFYGRGAPNITTHTTTNTIYYAQPVDDNESSDEYFQSPSNGPFGPSTDIRNKTTILIDRQPLPPLPDDSQINIPIYHNQPYYPTLSSTPRTLYYPEPPNNQYAPSSTPIPLDNVPSKTNVRVFQVFPSTDNASVQIFPDPYYSTSYSGVTHSRNTTLKNKPTTGTRTSQDLFVDLNNPQPEVIFSRDSGVVLSNRDSEFEESKPVPVYKRPLLNSKPSERTLSSTTERNSKSGTPPDYNRQYYRQSTPPSILSENTDDKPTADLPISDAIRVLLRPYFDKSEKVTNDMADKAETHIMSLVKKKTPTSKPDPLPPLTFLEPPRLPSLLPSSSPSPLNPASLKPDKVDKEVELIFTGEQAAMSQNNPLASSQKINHPNQQNILKPTNNWPSYNRHTPELSPTHPNIPNLNDNEYDLNPNREFTTKSTLQKPISTSTSKTDLFRSSTVPESTTRPYNWLGQGIESQEIDYDMSQKTVPTKFDGSKNNCEFDCGNGSCIKLFEVCDGINNCNNRNDEKQCDHLGYEVRLSNEDGSHNKGRVEVKILGKWGYVCDDKFGLRNADVLCRELGFPLGAKEVQGNSFYPASADMLNEQNQVSFVMDEVDCSGNETSLKDCEFKGWGVHDCTSDEIVGVECKIQSMKCKSDNYWLCTTSKQCIPHSFLCDNTVDCDDKTDESDSVCNSPIVYRLVNGSNPDEGRVEVRYHGVWGTICDDDFNENEAKVVCRSLGYSGPTQIVKNAFGPGTGPIWLDQVSCSGNETSIDKCIHWKWGEHNCNHSEDISLKCSSGYSPNKLHKPNQKIDLSNLERSSKIIEPKCGQFIQNVSDENEYPEERTMGGSYASFGQHPWMASIRARVHNGNSYHWCGAVIISDKHLLTAAHCLIGYLKTNFFIRMGNPYTNIYQRSETDAFIENWYIHKQFRQGSKMNNDIALISIKSPIRFNDYIQPICLPTIDSKYTDGKLCKISGWGSYEFGNTATSNKLLSAEIPIISDNKCKQSQIYETAFTKNMFCAGYLDGSVDACKGDSGGPFVCSDNDGETLYGIISWGERCGEKNKPGVYVKVNQYLDWIQEHIEESLQSLN